MLKFSNAETAAQFEALVEDDRTVTKQLLYSGLLSNIPPAMAAAMVGQGSNLVKEKSTTNVIVAEPKSFASDHVD